MHALPGPKNEATHVVLLLHVHLSRGPADVELLVLGHLADLAIMALVADGGGRGEDEGAGYDDGHEG